METTEYYIKEMITPRPPDAHKGSCGRVLLVCGSVGMAGAAVMSAKAALRSGAGLVTVCLPREIFPIVQTAVPEAMCMDREAVLGGEVDLDSFDCIGAGPGLGTGHEQYRLIEHLLLTCKRPIVLDADGLNSLCLYGRAPEKETYMGGQASPETDGMNIPRRMTSLLPQITGHRKTPVILTPHPGEADRLLRSLDQRKCKELGREKAAEVLARESGAIVVLKGPESLVAQPGMEKEVDLFRNPTGNPGMATGGSGDVLTGIAAALIAYGQACLRGAKAEHALSEGAIAAGISPLDATRTAVYMHGLAGDIAAQRRGQIGMTAMDIIDALPEAFLRIAGR